MPQQHPTDSWHDSLPFSIPHRRRKKKPSMLQESTIFKRHAARHERNAQLRNDPRGKAFRILSLLPGMNLLIPPYDPKLHGSKQTKQQQSSLLDFDALFADSNLISFGTHATTPQPTLSFMSSVLMTGASALTAHTVWSKPAVQHITSPFASSTTTACSSPPPSIVLTSTGDLKVLRTFPALRQFAPRVPLPYHISHASIVALGLPFVVREQIQPGAMANIVAGLVSGCVVSVAQRIPSSTTTPLGFRSMLGASANTISSPVPHIALAVASLSLYDAAISNGMWATALAGAISGALTATVRSPSAIPRHSMTHATFFVLYRSLYQSLLPPAARP